MNVIIANKYKDALSSLEIDVIKRLDGEFDVSTIIDTFANFYFNRMILDITAIKDYVNISTIQRLSAALDATKIILFLSDDPRINNAYLSKVISLGIYNFTSDINGVNYLMQNPNGYRDVAQYHDLAMNDEKNLKESKNSNLFGAGSMPNQAYTMPSGGFAPNLQRNASTPNNPAYQSFMGASYNGNAPYNMPGSQPASVTPSTAKIIGFKDLTDDAGATTLVYMLKKNMRGKKVLAVEINNNDFSYFNDNELMSISANQIGSLSSKFDQFDIILIDLNNSNLDTSGFCNDVIYLMEPSTIKVNALMRRDRQALEKIKNKKIVLNKSLLTTSDTKEFEYEAKVKIFYNIPPLDERKDTQMVLDTFLEKLGIFADESSGSGGFFGIFKK